MFPRANVRILYTLLSAFFLIAGTVIAIQYAKGNYRVTRSGFVPESGLLSANSFPTGAEVYVNEKLVTATDDTIYLEPGEYSVKISKDGYWPWEKKLQVEKELVSQTNAQLFPRVPSLTPLTFSGVQNISPSPDGQKLMYYTASASAETKNGLYVLELSTNQLSLQKGSRQIAFNGSAFDLQNTSLIWAPDSTEILAHIPLLQGNSEREFFLDLDKKNDLATLSDVGFQKRSVLAKWQEEMYVRERQYMQKFPPEIIEMATTSAKNVYLSPSKEKLLYTATAAASIPEDIVPPLPSRNTQPEARQLEPGGIYVYDREEDKNFLVGYEKKEASTSAKMLLATDLFSREPLTIEASPAAFQTLQATTSAETTRNFATYHTPLYSDTFQWFPDSEHLISTTDGEIHIKEYDGTNDTTVYSGPFDSRFVYPWPDGSRLIILTSFSPNSPQNLYAIDLK